MFIIATCVSSSDKRVVGYEVVSSVPATLANNQFSVPLNSTTVPDGFYESFDKYTVGTVNGGNGFVQVSGSTLTQRYLAETTAGIKAELGVSDAKAAAIVALPWTVERINKIRNIAVL